MIARFSRSLTKLIPTEWGAPTFEIDGVKIDLGQVKMPIYNLATREDHIAPAKSVYLGSSYFGGPVRFVLSGSGHIAGIVNPPDKMKYQYWTGDRPRGDDLEGWIGKAAEHPGSWWTEWVAWIRAQDGEEVAARPQAVCALTCRAMRRAYY